MKSKIFKIVLPAFALMLAITASLAFTPANDHVVEDGILVSTAYFRNGIQNPCLQLFPVSCQLEFVEDQICAVNINGLDRALFFTKIQALPSCVTLLYKYQE
ncbi:DUF6520 family protein [Flavivirga abyssicola]|uniref:DUF6520 family protein n=1 Tax=Flavivirga abyssicola TaxID=3063533 RepID=UPI0026DF0BE9|nr:DUF6520 family protein [Flavivirga sp. MEBiC07777]WVK14137.1 DUF6520 family protein [Flavivirga sp. MEBiC07777]